MVTVNQKADGPTKGLTKPDEEGPSSGRPNRTRGGRGRTAYRGRGGSGRGSGPPRAGKGPVNLDNNVRSQNDPAQPKAGQSPMAKPTPIPPPNPTPIATAKSAVSLPNPSSSTERHSQNVPELVIHPLNPPDGHNTLNKATPSHSSDRRRRSSQQTEPSSSSTGKHPPIRNNRARDHRSSSNLNNPTEEAPSRLTPPSPSNSTDMRRDIASLVEHTRAIAMDNRPTTPGSHIDWADDDNTLPDLDDWGVTTSTEQKDAISPILENVLMPLPDALPPIASPSMISTRETDMTMPASLKSGDKPRPSPYSAPPQEDRSAKVGTRPFRGEAARAKPTRHPPSVKPSNRQTGDSDTSVPIAKARQRRAQPNQQIPNPTLAATFKSAQHGIVPAECNDTSSLNRNEGPIVKSSTSEAVRDRVAALVETEVKTTHKQVVDLDALPGLEASIHAPKPQPVAMIAGSDPKNTSVSDPPSLASASVQSDGPLTSLTVRDRFNPTHRRSHTVGRYTNQSSSNVPTPSLQTESSTHPPPPDGNPHTRAQSTPITGSSRTHRALNQRPVITGDAIMKLAKTLKPQLPAVSTKP